MILRLFCFCLFCFFATVLLSGCIATSNYYTGRTLEPGKEAARFGADYILNTASDGNHVQIGVAKDFPISFIPSVGLAFGLPLRLETGIRWYPPKFLEGSLRWQINPRKFDAFDASLNYSYAGLIGEYSYARYGITISKNINETEPYMSYSFYHVMGKSNNNFFSDNSSINKDFMSPLNSSRSVALGVAVPIGNTKLFPEIDYVYFRNDPSRYLWSFGIGIQVSAN